jgi:hypothetical protein
MRQTLLPRTDAADYLRISARTLEKWAMTGEGPPYIKVGSRSKYLLDDLNVWLMSRRQISTTDTYERGNS